MQCPASFYLYPIHLVLRQLIDMCNCCQYITEIYTYFILMHYWYYNLKMFIWNLIWKIIAHNHAQSMGIKIYWLYPLQRAISLKKVCSKSETASDGDSLWGEKRASLLSLLPGPLWPGMVVPIIYEYNRFVCQLFVVEILIDIV